MNKLSRVVCRGTISFLPARIRRAMSESLKNLRDRVTRAYCRAASAHLGTDKTMYAVYDMGREPVTFDFILFMGAVDLERRRRGLDHVHFLFVPGRMNGFREEWPDYERIVDRDARLWRIANLLLPSLRLLPACSGHTVCESRAQAQALIWLGGHLYPADYDVGCLSSEGYVTKAYHEVMEAGRQGLDVNVMRATPQARRYVDRWLESRAAGRRVISITLREYGYNPARNSNLSAWVEFARNLDQSRYYPVFLRDLDVIFDTAPAAFEGLEMFDHGPVNLELRMALYERSYLNLGSSNGPLALCMLGDGHPYIMFKMLTPDVPQATEEFMTQLGIEIGAPHMPFANEFQRLVWEDDSPEVIHREFMAMTVKLERVGNEGSSTAEAVQSNDPADHR